MSAVDELTTSAAGLAQEIATAARALGSTVGVAESLTGGRIATRLAAAEESSAWFAGGIVSYGSEVKHRALGVPRGPVISEQAVTAMAEGAAALLGADAVVAASGAGGPGGQEGNPPGTTWLAVRVGGVTRTELHRFDGEPLEVLARTEDAALRLLRGALHDAHDERGGPR
ncbi:CinA family protein [Brevibacterium ihuae]|uniref:CinA family protein n=1 Tax=Brevibacterium ihuae TaxID=1631743 RepID=UPI000C788ABA|nr:CinA family protein [Brevibacterium ihuae]